MFNKRWYDKDPKTNDAISLLMHLDQKSQDIISRDMTDIANSIRSVRKEQNSLPLSLGVKRVLGLYQSENNRRWYDKNDSLNQAFKTISTLPEEDFQNIMEGICVSLKG